MSSGKEMWINAKTRIRDLLNVNQEEVITVLVTLNKNFAKLRNPVLRNLFAGRISIEDACKIAGCSLKDFLKAMNTIGFQIEHDAQDVLTREPDQPSVTGKEKIVEFDVRPLLARNEDPLKIILKKITDLPEGYSLKIINTFEPVPLIHRLEKKGFSHYTERAGPELVFTSFYRQTVPLPVSDINHAPKVIPAESHDFDTLVEKFRSDKLQIIDVRELEMPKPMLQILEKLEKLTSGEALFVYHRKTPVHLLPELKERGFRYILKDTEDGKVNILIYK